MQAYIHFLKGNLQGHRYKVNPGATLGRKGADINLPDSKVSSLHGQFLIEGDQFVLVDIGSRNGFVINGKKVKKVSLYNGLIIQVGDTIFMIEGLKKFKDNKNLEIDLDDSNSRSLELDFDGLDTYENQTSKKNNYQPKFNAPEYPQFEDETEVKPKEVLSDDWSGYFIDFSRESIKNISNLDLQVVPFKNPVILKITRGPQLNTKWTLGYGPRFAGRSSFDIPIEELEAPETCFSLTPSKEGAVFKTQFPSSVLLNRKSIKSDIIKNGDIISIFGTEISIGLLDE